MLQPNSEQCWFQNSRRDRGQFFFLFDDKQVRAEVVLQIIIQHLGGTFSIMLYLYMSVKYCNACYFNVTLIWQKQLCKSSFSFTKHFSFYSALAMWKRALNICTVDRWLFWESLVSLLTIIFLLICFCWDALKVFKIIFSSLLPSYHVDCSYKS